MALFGICMLVLYAPKLLGTAAFLREPRLARPARLATIFGLLAELLLSRAGRADHDAGADELGRADPDRPRQRLERRRRATPTGCPGRCSGASTAATCWPALLLAVAAGAISWRLLAWMSPALLGLVLAVPLSAFMGSAAAGRGLARAGACSLTPEERHPPAARRRRRRARPTALRAARPRPRRPRRAFSPIPAALARHLAWLDPPTARRPGEPDAALANALLKLADGLGLDRARRRARPSPCSPRRRRSRASRRVRPIAAPRGEGFVMLAATRAVRWPPDLGSRRSDESVTREREVSDP